MNQTIADAGNPPMFPQSATGDAIPDSQAVSFVRSAPAPFVPVRFSVLEYGIYTKQAYDGADRATADAAWANIEHGIFLATDADHACRSLDKR
jgi:hypothetical protein